jgi:hypothetical protein
MTTELDRDVEAARLIVDVVVVLAVGDLAGAGDPVVVDLGEDVRVEAGRGLVEDHLHRIAPAVVVFAVAPVEPELFAAGPLVSRRRVADGADVAEVEPHLLQLGVPLAAQVGRDRRGRPELEDQPGLAGGSVFPGAAAVVARIGAGVGARRGLDGAPVPHSGARRRDSQGRNHSHAASKSSKGPATVVCVKARRYEKLRCARLAQCTGDVRTVRCVTNLRP